MQLCFALSFGNGVINDLKSNRVLFDLYFISVFVHHLKKLTSLGTTLTMGLSKTFTHLFVHVFI